MHSNSDGTRMIAMAGMALACGCATQLYSPPARGSLLESPATVGAGRAGIQAAGGAHGMLFGPSVYTGSLRFRYGLREDLDANAEATALVVESDEPFEFDESNVALAGRAGLKYGLLKHLALTGSLGAGGSAAGGFFSSELGLIAGFDNPYIVPFVSLQGGLSLPFYANTIELVDRNETIDNITRLRPYPTGILSFATGVKVPIASRTCEVCFNFLAGLQISYLLSKQSEQGTSGTQTAQFVGANAGAEVTF